MFNRLHTRFLLFVTKASAKLLLFGGLVYEKTDFILILGEKDRKIVT